MQTIKDILYQIIIMAIATGVWAYVFYLIGTSI